MTPKIVLASGSAIRATMLRNAGVPFSAIRPDVDEDEIKLAPDNAGLSAGDLAQKLADAKALAVENPGAIIIGSDQILAFDGVNFDKPKSIDDAKDRLSLLQGKTHHLVNAVAAQINGDVIWRHQQSAALTMHPMDRQMIDAYFEEAPKDILSSVGAYQVEGLGARLFEKIDGDYFTVLGMSLFPLLSFLRRQNALPY